MTRETNETTMIAAHKAGIAYWRNNRPADATTADLEMHARTCGWHGEDCAAWIAGFYGAKHRGERHITRDIGLSIRDHIEGKTAHRFVESDDGELKEHSAQEIDFVDVSDPDNLVLHLDNGQTFTLRIIAGS